MYVSQFLVRWGLCGQCSRKYMVQYLHNTVCNDILYFLSTLSKCGIAPSGRSLSPYKISYKNRTGLPDVF